MRFASGFLLAAVGCSHEAPATTTKDPCNDGGAYERVEVTDEACRSFTEAESRGQVVVDAARAPSWSSPPTKVPAAESPILKWTKGTLARSSWQRWLRAINPIGEAWAHGDTTGDAFVLTFRDPAGKALHRALTTFTQYQPSSASWQKIKAAGAFSVTLTGVRFTVNVIASGTKPTSATPITVTVE